MLHTALPMIDPDPDIAIQPIQYDDEPPSLFVGEIFSGSLAEIKSWATPLSKSKFQQHTLNKFSTIGNSLTSHCDELIYHYTHLKQCLTHTHIFLNLSARRCVQMISTF